MLAQFRRRAGDGRGDPCRAPRPHHPRLSRPLQRRQRGGACARRRAGAPRAAPPSSASRSRIPAARARRSGRGKAAGRCKPGADPWQTMAASPIPFGENWHTPREVTEDDMERVRAAFVSAASARCASASTRSSCTWRMAIWRTASCRRCPTSAPTNTAARSKIACAFRCRSRARCARWCRRSAARRAHHRQRLAAGRPHARRRGRHRQGAEGGGHRFHLHLLRRRHRRHAQSDRARLQRADRGARARKRPACHAYGRADPDAGAGRGDRRRGQGRPGVDRARLPRRPALGLARCQGARRRRAAPAAISRAGPKLWAPAAAKG